jgi:type I restriction enzyme, S subunit
MSTWRQLEMRELMAEFHDGPHATPPPAESGPVYLGIKNITEAGHLDLTSVRHISTQDFEDWTRRATPMPGDVVFSYEATLHRYALIPEGFKGCLGRRIALIRPDQEVVNPRFLHYMLLGPVWRRTIESRIIAGATVDRIPINEFPSFPVAIPDRGTQERIAEVLAALDDLIENYRLRIRLLDQMAEAIYREWFVRFRYPAHVGDVLVDTPVGPIPEGWAVQGLFDVADVGFGFSFKSKRFKNSGPFPVVRIRDIPAGRTSTFTDEEPTEKYRVMDGDVLIGMDGDFHIGQWTGGLAWLNQRVARLRPREQLAARHLMLAITEPIRKWNAAISGTTVAHLGKRHLEQVQVVVPSSDRLATATDCFDHIAKQECALVQASRRLAEVRDLLLPRLVTGEVDVSDLDLGTIAELDG